MTLDTFDEHPVGQTRESFSTWGIEYGTRFKAKADVIEWQIFVIRRDETSTGARPSTHADSGCPIPRDQVVAEDIFRCGHHVVDAHIPSEFPLAEPWIPLDQRLPNSPALEPAAVRFANRDKDAFLAGSALFQVRSVGPFTLMSAMV